MKPIPPPSIPPNSKDLIHSPARAGKLTYQTVEMLQADKSGGVTFGVTEIDNHLLPLRPGDLVTVWGYTSFWKSHLMDFLVAQETQRIMKRQQQGESQSDIVIKVTWEQSIEEDTLNNTAAQCKIPVARMVGGKLTDAEWQTISDATVKRQTTPLWLIGHSLVQSIEQRHPRPRMDLSEVWECVDEIVNHIAAVRLNPRLIVLDYLQRMPPDRSNFGDSRREYVGENAQKAKDLAIGFGCPVCLGVQVGRQVLDYSEAMPTLRDAQESSAIEQASDKVLGLWYPIKTRRGGVVDNIPVTANLLLMSKLKEKLGKAPVDWIMDINPEIGVINSARLRSFVPVPPPAASKGY